MRRIVRAVRGRLRRLVRGGDPQRRLLPLARNTFEKLGGDVVVPDVEGRLVVARLSDDGASQGRHRTVFVPGPDYGGMEDNDIRGLLDGTFLYGWNQVDQKYVRAGRIDDVFKYGEYELFRILQRWEAVSLPEGATLDDVELRLSSRSTKVTGVRSLFLYAVKRDWQPGRGGVERDNASPPEPGDVWWNDRRFGQEPWGMPGASSDEDLHPAPLARCTLEPGVEAVSFRSDALTRYASGRIEAGEPLLFLIKLQDHQEDIPGSIVYLWSATEGEDRSEGRKPRLTLWWRAQESVLVDTQAALEHGRSCVHPAAGANFAEFVPAAGSGGFELAARNEEGVWRRLIRGRLREGDVAVRVRAVTSPVLLGEPFSLTFRDTWVRTAAPEDQRIPFSFDSPTGNHHEVMARYTGAFTWAVEFVPDEPGLWRYRWQHRLQSKPFLSPEECFDVVVECLPQALSALERFLALVRATDVEDREGLSRLMVRFSKLERAAVAQLTPAQFRGEAGAQVRDLLKQVRDAFGSPVPDDLPMVVADPPPWKTP